MHTRIVSLILFLLCITGMGGPLFAAGTLRQTEAGEEKKSVAKNEIATDSPNETRPVYIVYGLGYQNVDFLMNSLTEIKEALVERGIPAFISEKEAFAPIEDNARTMGEEIISYLRKYPEYTKVDIIAHSKGGLEARYMISRLDMAEHVASLTTLATPHRGSPLAEFLMEDTGEGGSTVATIVADAVGLLLGDSNPDSDVAVTQLTPHYMETFNALTPDHPQVYYLSYASQLGDEYPSLLYRTIGRAVYRAAGPNDGLVPVESAKWGEFGGLICELYGHSGLNHSDIIGGNPWTRNKEFDYVSFFLDIVKKVQER